MAAEADRVCGAPYRPDERGAGQPPQRHLGTALGHSGGDDGPRDPPSAQGELLPGLVVGATAPGGAGVDAGGDGVLRAGRLHAVGGRPGADAGPVRPLLDGAREGALALAVRAALPHKQGVLAGRVIVRAARRHPQSRGSRPWLAGSALMSAESGSGQPAERPVSAVGGSARDVHGPRVLLVSVRRTKGREASGLAPWGRPNADGEA